MIRLCKDEAYEEESIGAEGVNESQGSSQRAQLEETDKNRDGDAATRVSTLSLSMSG